MTVELSNKFIEFYNFRKNTRAVNDENAETNRSIKSTWKIEEVLVPGISIINTPSGKFLLYSENGRTRRLSRIDHLENQ